MRYRNKSSTLGATLLDLRMQLMREGEELFMVIGGVGGGDGDGVGGIEVGEGGRHRTLSRQPPGHKGIHRVLQAHDFIEFSMKYAKNNSKNYQKSCSLFTTT